MQKTTIKNKIKIQKNHQILNRLNNLKMQLLKIKILIQIIIRKINKYVKEKCKSKSKNKIQMKIF